ncbi:hypothetical protein SLEP1_g53538 [Rubroshorea leprosula]|uniref:Uncharacterized protein n=1 Tax=Rubroshorea leprosula TaxID=152421 RepID=A0AAV5M9W0_9ROSI|nr:hypothetical protein SLEP1_g53538 [Rubroshorea leprosula]
MASFHDAQGFWGNQGGEEEVDVISVELIAMIVPPELQDSPRTTTPESSTSSSTSGGSDDHQPSMSSDSLTEVTPSEAEGAEEESKVLSGRLDNLRKAPKTLPTDFKFKAALHHEVADGAATVKGYKKLEEMVRQYQIPRTILIRAGTPNEQACSVSVRAGPFATYSQQHQVYHRLSAVVRKVGDVCKGGGLQSLFLYRLCPSTSGTRWYYISRREKMMIFTNIRNKLTVGDVDLKNRLLNHVKAGGLVDLEALVTPDQIALFGKNEQHPREATSTSSRLEEPGAGSGSQRQTHFDERLPAALGCSSSHRSSSSTSRPCVEQRVEPAPSSSRWRAREDSNVEDDIPLIRQRTSTGNQPAPTAAARPANMPPAPAREVAEPAPASSSVAGPRIAYPDGFNYVRTECQAAMLYTVALFECEQGARVQNRELEHNCKQLASEKASLANEVSHLQSSEMANRVTSAESRADELARKINELKEELERLKWRRRPASKLPRRSLADVVAVASANTTTDIFNKVCGKVLRVRADFPIGEPAFFEGEKIDAKGKSLTQPADTRVKLKWELNEEGLPVWPPTVVEEGEDTKGLPSFDAWVVDPKDVPFQHSSFYSASTSARLGCCPYSFSFRSAISCSVCFYAQ